MLFHFLFNICSPEDGGVAKKRGGAAIETQWELEGPSWVQKSFCVPHFLFVGERLQSPRTSLSSKGQIQIVNN